MSTYYFLVCDDHKEKTDAASRAAGGICHYRHSDDTLLPFIVNHSGCNIKIIPEHEEDDEKYEKYKHWKPEDL